MRTKATLKEGKKIPLMIIKKPSIFILAIVSGIKPCISPNAPFQRELLLCVLGADFGYPGVPTLSLGRVKPPLISTFMAHVRLPSRPRPEHELFHYSPSSSAAPSSRSRFPDPLKNLKRGAV